jgi:hypothetical protein
MMKAITINGKDYPCRITMGAMLRFKHESGHDVSKMQQDDVADLVTFLWCCVASASKADNVDFTLSVEDFADVLAPETLNGFYADMSNTEKKTAK